LRSSPSSAAAHQLQIQILAGDSPRGITRSPSATDDACHWISAESQCNIESGEFAELQKFEFKQKANELRSIRERNKLGHDLQMVVQYLSNCFRFENTSMQ